MNIPIVISDCLCQSNMMTLLHSRLCTLLVGDVGNDVGNEVSTSSLDTVTDTTTAFSAPLLDLGTGLHVCVMCANHFS